MFNAPRTRATNFASSNPFGGGSSGGTSTVPGPDPLAQSAYAPEVDDPWGSSAASAVSASTPNLLGGGGGGFGGMLGFGSSASSSAARDFVLPESSIPPAYLTLYETIDTSGSGDVSLSSLNRFLGSGGLDLPPSGVEKIVTLVAPSGSASTINRQQFFVLTGLAALAQQGKEPSIDALLRTSPLPVPTHRAFPTSSSSGLSVPPPPNNCGISASSSSAFGGSPWGGPASSSIQTNGNSSASPRIAPTSPPNPRFNRQDTWRRQESFTGPSASVNGNVSGVEIGAGMASPGITNGYALPSGPAGPVGSPQRDDVDRAYLTGAGGFGGADSAGGADAHAPKDWWRQLENVDVTILQKEGYFLQKYRVESDKRASGAVIRRYSDFLWLLDVLSKRYPFRLLPNLPPKRIGPDQAFLEQRRKGLKRFLNAIINHPILKDDGALAVFMSEPNFEAWRKRMKVSTEEESTSKNLDQAAEARIPADLDAKLGVLRKTLPLLLDGQIKLVVLAEKSLRRIEAASGDQSRIAMTLASLGERFSESCWRCAGQDENRGGIGGGGCDLCRGVGRGLGAIGEAWAREAEESDKRLRALTLGSLEALKSQRDLYIAFRDLLVRHDRLSKDNVDTLQKRVEATQKKLDSTRSAKRPGWEAAAEKLVASVEQDASAISLAMTRRVFIRHCAWHELSVVLHSRHTAQNTLGWRQYASDREQTIIGTSEIWRSLGVRLENMPVD